MFSFPVQVLAGQVTFNILLLWCNNSGELMIDMILVFVAAYKHADGKKIDGRRVLVDVERGRTVKGWRPRRLGQLLAAVL
jgi:hypothetical protein